MTLQTMKRVFLYSFILSVIFMQSSSNFINLEALITNTEEDIFPATVDIVDDSNIQDRTDVNDKSNHISHYSEDKEPRSYY